MKRPTSSRPPVFEKLEDRRLMSASPAMAAGRVSDVLLQDYASYLAAPASQESSFVGIDATSRGNGALLQKQLAKIGLTDSARFDGVVSGKLPVAAIGGLKNVRGLKFAQATQVQFDPTGLPAVNGTTAATQSTTTLNQEASIALGANVARTVFAANGTGIKVGIISNSFNATKGYSQDVSAGLLPSNVTVLKDDLTAGNDDEGRAMAQVVHDVAPGAQLYFQTSGSGQANMAQAILALKAAGCRVIVDDVVFLNEPTYEDGLIARAVNTVESQGVSYFAAVGNYAANSYEAAWKDGGALKVGTTTLPGHAQNFNPTGTASLGQQVTIPYGQTATVALQWDSNYASLNPTTGGSKNQLNVYLVDSTGAKIVASGTTATIGKDPIQELQFVNKTASSTFYVVITLASGPAPKFVKFVMFGHTGGDSSSVSINSHNSGGTVAPHAVATGSMGVAAVPYTGTPAYGITTVFMEPFSSMGVDNLLFDDNGVRLATAQVHNIAISSVDGIDCNVHGSSIFAPFDGTSCAAPNAAAVAAIMLSVAPKATPAQIYSAMETTALNIKTYAPYSGSGLIQAYQATSSLAAKLLPAPLANDSISGTVRLNEVAYSTGATPTGPGLSGVEMYIDSNNNFKLDAGEKYVYTDASGNFSFKGLKPGVYTVLENYSVNAFVNYPLIPYYTEVLGPGQAATGLLFGDYVYG